jgi:hypothetical protein
MALLLIGLIFGGGLGFVLAAGNGITLDGHDHSDPAAHGDLADHGDMAASDSAHDHGEMLMLPAGENAPALRIAVTKDPVSGWNLQLMPSNFRFAPEHSGDPHIAGEGHAHLYVNGQKVARVYGAWFHIASLPPGESVIEVTLNSNDHKSLSVGGTEVAQRITVSAD